MSLFYPDEIKLSSCCKYLLLLCAVEQEDGEGYVYSFPLLHPDFCARLVKEASAFRSFRSSLSPSADRTVSSALKHFGLRWLDEALLKEVLEPLATLVFPSMLDGGHLDWCHGYVASYEASALASAADVATKQVSAHDTDGTDTLVAQRPRRFNDKLNAHTDDSEVTLNVGLVDTFTGGELHFRHVRGAHRFSFGCAEPICQLYCLSASLTGIRPLTSGTDWEGQTEPFSYMPEIGRGLIHMGRHLHEVLPVTSGDRHQYILWARSTVRISVRVCNSHGVSYFLECWIVQAVWMTFVEALIELSLVPFCLCMQSMRAKQCPCCWQNFRQGKELRECVCGPAWN